MGIAPFKGTVSLYSYLDFGHVMIQKNNYEFTVITQEIFHQLYYELDDSKAALKGDCIEYCTYHPNKPLIYYPDWFGKAMEDGWIVNDYPGDLVFLEETGEVAMSPGSVILRNIMGDLKYMERDDFVKYYEPIDEWYYKYM